MSFAGLGTRILTENEGSWCRDGGEGEEDAQLTLGERPIVCVLPLINLNERKNREREPKRVREKKRD